jgi:hypothetical protein
VLRISIISASKKIVCAREGGLLYRLSKKPFHNLSGI